MKVAAWLGKSKGWLAGSTLQWTVHYLVCLTSVKQAMAMAGTSLPVKLRMA